MRLSFAAACFFCVPAFAQAEAPAAPPAAPAAAPVAEAPPAIAGGTVDAPKLVAVLDLKPATPESTSTASALTTMLTAEVAQLPGFKAITRNEIKSILSHSADAQLAGCNEPRCAADVAALVNADVLVTGQVDKVGGATVVSLSLIDAGNKDGSEGPAVAGRQESAFRGPDDQLLNLARPLVQRLFDGANAANHKGILEVFSPDGVTVVVDGKEVGKTPLAAMRDMTTGVHTVALSKDGHFPQTVDVVVSRNETTITRVELVEQSLFEQPWFWATAGGVALVAAGTTVGIVTYGIVNAETPTRVTLGKPAE